MNGNLSPWVAEWRIELTMNGTTLRLIERRPRVVKLHLDDVDYLLNHCAHLFELLPTGRRHHYRITSRGVVGWLAIPTGLVEIAPRIPWPNLSLLMGLSSEPSGETQARDVPVSLANLLGREFLETLKPVLRTGFDLGYHENENVSQYLRGKLRVVDQLRKSSAQLFPTWFHIVETGFSEDTPRNRILRHVTDWLLQQAGITPELRHELKQIDRTLANVTLQHPTGADFANAESEPLPSSYRAVLNVARLIWEGCNHPGFVRSGRTSYLIDLPRLFERFLQRELQSAVSATPRWSVVVHPRYLVGPVVFQPDILLLDRGEPFAILDAKWKGLEVSPNPADLHQLLAYALLSKATRVALIYPGTRTAVRELARLPGNIQVLHCRIQVRGSRRELVHSVESLLLSLRRRTR